jgi:hypothetical protein
MKNPTSQNKWLMVLNIGGMFHDVLFDGQKVYDTSFPSEEIVAIPCHSGVVLNQEILSETCKNKMQNMKVVSSAFDGTWVAENKDTPFTLSVASETYWST